MDNPEQWYWDIPSITRVYSTCAVITALLVVIHNAVPHIVVIFVAIQIHSADSTLLSPRVGLLSVSSRLLATWLLENIIVELFSGGAFLPISYILAALVLILSFTCSLCKQNA